jgi:Cu(I)/Ag(I) efflux system membrane fusion protein
MNRTLTGTALLLAAVVLGIAIGRLWFGGDTGQQGGTADAEREILYWVAPMDPNYRRDEPGKSPMGMDLVPFYADEAAADAAMVEIDPTVVNNLGIRTAPVLRGALSRRVETVGYVSYDEDTLEHIHSRVDGWIERLAVKAAGDPIEKGQLLYQLYSPTLVNAQEEYLAALASSNRTLQQASRERLEALGVTELAIARLDADRTANRLVSIYAQSDGYAANLGVREGIYITPASEVMSVAQLDEVWVLVEVFERQASWIREGQQAQVELDYVPGQSWQGAVDYVYPELDPETRTLKVRLRFANQSRVFRPNMFARVTIFGSETEPLLHVPRSALIRGGNVDRVVVALGDGRFRAQPVDVGIESGGRVEIRAGISEGDLVVTSGQFLIDSESNIESALARMDAESAEGLPDRVRIGAVVRSIDPAAPAVTLQHDPVPEWSWPAMTMSFDIADPALIAGLEPGEAVDIVIERYADGRHRITEIMPADDAMESGDELDNGRDEMPAGTENIDHDMELGE